MEDRVRALEAWRGEVEGWRAAFSRELKANTEMTAAVKADTQELVELFRASKTNLRIIKWIAGAAGAFGTAWAAWRHLP